MSSAPALIVVLTRALQCLLPPARSGARLIAAAAGDLTRTRSELIADNAFVRQQAIVLQRSIERPQLHRDHRLLLLVLARLTRSRQDALPVVSLETLRRCHRDLFKIIWRSKSPLCVNVSLDTAGVG